MCAAEQGCTCPQYSQPTPPPRCAESVRMQHLLTLAWSENYRVRAEGGLSRHTDTYTRSEAQAKLVKRKLDCLEAASAAALILAVVAAVACIKWLVG